MVTDSYDSLSDFIAIPRIDGLALSPDGARTVLTVATLNKDATAYERALWEVPATAGATGDPVRLTRSAKGEAGAAFTSTGDVLFTSTRPDADGDDEKSQLWLLSAHGGEARCISRLAGGVSGIEALAADARAAILGAHLMPSASSLEDDARIRAARTKGKVNAILHSTYPIRDWDHDLGPAEPHLLALDLDGVPAEAARAEVPVAKDDGDAPTPYPETLPRPRDLTPQPGLSVDHRGVAVSPDGSTVIAALSVPVGRSSRTRLVSIDVASGAHTVLADEEGVDFVSPVISPDGASLAYGRGAKSTPAGPADQELWIANLDGSGAREIAADWDRWAASTAFSADGSALIVTADHDGRCPVFSIDVTTGEVTQITHDAAAYSAVAVDRTGAGLVALRATMLEPAHPVRIAFDGTVTRLANPAPAPEVSATLTDVDATAEDGTRVRGWLLTPPSASAASPAPLLLWIHGGPLNSWNQWSWRWSPALAVAQGYAVLLPDPALSTGYGLEFIARGWNSWGHKPYTDLLSITDAVESRPEIDETRTAAMGGSFGGYMANWVAGHTDRFDAIVTHAALWSLDQFGPTTDHADYWQSIFTPEAMVEHSPHHSVAEISTPMLVIHGDKDYRVPIGEGLRLWAELAEHFAAPDGSMDHRFLYFPDENHWILKPQHAIVWYETVFAFLAQHVRGEDRTLPEVLG
ncbi:prolyl oligopeptidase family serine peptidase [Demequina sp. EGI L300058]|uniref:Prolyl oligopeptidase family serine peptidase n=1 Tax=Demequina muriae TaxID=3051664 RepID=A0ABT8GFK4_9MICO|nr:alpha/beta fold hydrolase [Demequina sp. EGI L300058]MDN4480221.1 prolyl oligopeptidase family serine peptidase [Demequina sp. EGI L300058]